ncbi:hypothetical protein ABWK22_02385 [Gottfriedia acidiceleris]|uniref:hypothetical protein n=1 Tax=Gottfriedia acidiceleris TaxID=371036 RepID=UPI00339948BE
MRFINKSELLQVGQRRVVRKFLWFPVKLSNETRWLEHANIEQVVRNIDVGGSMEWGNYKKMWRNLAWAE